jgi:RES domain
MIQCEYCCHEDLFSTFKYLKEDYIPGAWLVEEYDNEMKECLNCNKVLSEKDHIIPSEEQFLEEALQYLATKINPNIYECQSCNSDIIQYEQKHGDPLNLQTIGELLDDYSIPDDLQPMLYQYLRCNCGNPVSPDDPYISEEEYKSWFKEEVEFIIQTFEISGDETIAFIDFLQEHPMLGLAHPVGNQIFEKIKNGDFPGIEKLGVGSVYYRGRKRNKHQRLVPFIDTELWNPPIGIPRQGRYNPHGVTNLYLCNNKEATISEVHPSKLDIIDIAELVTLKELKVFNSTKTDIDIFAGNDNEHDGFSSSYEYIFPNFLSQCLAYNEFNGIIYESVKNTNALNLCLFNFTKNEDIRITDIHKNINVQKKLSHDDFLCEDGSNEKQLNPTDIF